ncbi:WYL domain-containing protein [Aeromonas caviae]|nr:WYL domain-containing protein [Aeromonas caviae]
MPRQSANRLSWVGEQAEQEIEPYRLVNKRGRWYLAGVTADTPFIEPYRVSPTSSR